MSSGSEEHVSSTKSTCGTGHRTQHAGPKRFACGRAPQFRELRADGVDARQNEPGARPDVAERLRHADGRAPGSLRPSPVVESDSVDDARGKGLRGPVHRERLGAACGGCAAEGVGSGALDLVCSEEWVSRVQ